ncbi:MAG: hypothetical protein K1X66_06285 [Verrucomicrobiae bacterium]|nr:hypothetical protein [Verrucomicrobiae bacterium]
MINFDLLIEKPKVILIKKNLKLVKVSKGNIVRTSITLDKEVAEIGKRNAEKRGFGHSFSAYVSWLVIRDAKGAVSREEITDATSAQNLEGTPQSITPSHNSPSSTSSIKLESNPTSYPGFSSHDPFAN